MDGLPISAIWKISIHTPTRGATNIVAAQQLHNIISIHTPAWGATRATRSQGKGNQNFNPHSRVGSDNIVYRTLIVFFYFNPHSRVGSDGAGRGSRQIYSISIHTPAWGATKDSTVLGHIIRISIHTPAWGATCLQKFCSHHREISIHTPAWGATISSCVCFPG